MPGAVAGGDYAITGSCQITDCSGAFKCSTRNSIVGDLWQGIIDLYHARSDIGGGICVRARNYGQSGSGGNRCQTECSGNCSIKINISSTCIQCRVCGQNYSGIRITQNHVGVCCSQRSFHGDRRRCGNHKAPSKGGTVGQGTIQCHSACI